MWQELAHYNDDPLAFTINTVINFNTPTSRSIREMLSTDVSELEQTMQRVRNDIAASTSSRRMVYKDINPELSVHSIYRHKHAVNDNS